MLIGQTLAESVLCSTLAKPVIILSINNIQVLFSSGLKGNAYHQKQVVVIFSLGMIHSFEAAVTILFIIHLLLH